jgi:haloalkane dehalogenase
MADFRLLFPKAPVVQLPGVGHFCQEDAPETLTAMIHQFIQANR